MEFSVKDLEMKEMRALALDGVSSLERLGILLNLKGANSG